MLNWGDTGQPASVRSFGTGCPGAALAAESRIYKQATLSLISHISTTHDNSPQYNNYNAQIQALIKRYHRQ
jgi:hypothetical protein